MSCSNSTSLALEGANLRSNQDCFRVITTLMVALVFAYFMKRKRRGPIPKRSPIITRCKGLDIMADSNVFVVSCKNSVIDRTHYCETCTPNVKRVLSQENGQGLKCHAECVDIFGRHVHCQQGCRPFSFYCDFHKNTRYAYVIFMCRRCGSETFGFKCTHCNA
jgi:hypothetical protein